MKTVAIVGGGPTRKQAPWNDLSIDIWQMNEAAGKSGTRASAVFQMHDPGIYKDHRNAFDPEHFGWLQSIHGFPIWMQKPDPQVPDSREYPLAEAKKLTEQVLQKGKSDRELRAVELFTFTGTYMIALAILMGYKRILMYGIEMVHTEEYRYQRESFLFWVGFAAGKGVELEIYGGDSMFKRPLYGYETFKEFKQVKLNNAERIRLMDVLPQTGSIVTMKVIHELKMDLSFNEDEISAMEIREVQPGETDPIDHLVNNLDQPMIKWTRSKETEREYEFGEVTRKVIQAAFAEVDKKQAFTEDLLMLYEKFTYE